MMENKKTQDLLLDGYYRERRLRILDLLMMNPEFRREKPVAERNKVLLWMPKHRLDSYFQAALNESGFSVLQLFPGQNSENMEEQIQLFQPDFVVDFDGFGHTAAGRISGAVILKAGDGPSPDCPAVYLRNIPAMKLFLEGKPVAQSVYSLLQQKFNFLFSGKRIIVSGCSQEADAMLTILKGVNASVRSDVREQLVTLTRLMSGIRPVKPEEYGEADVLFIAGEGQAPEINPENLKQEAIIFNMAGAGMEKRLRTHLRIERNLYDGKDDLCCRRYGEKRIYLYRDGADITADAFYDYPYEAADMIWSGILLSLRSLERGENAGTVRELELIIKLKIKALMGS